MSDSIKVERVPLSQQTAATIAVNIATGRHSVNHVGEFDDCLVEECVNARDVFRRAMTPGIMENK